MLTQKVVHEMFMAALFIIAKKYKQSRYPSTDEENKRWYIHMMDYYSAIKRIHATIWMNFENIMLSERSHTQKATCCMTPFT